MIFWLALGFVRSACGPTMAIPDCVLGMLQMPGLFLAHEM